MLATILVSALLLSQPEAPPSDPRPSGDGPRIAAEFAGGVLLGGAGMAGGVLLPCGLGGFQADGCLASFWAGYPIGLILGTSVGVLLGGSWLGGTGPELLVWAGAALGTLVSVLLAIVNPFLALAGPLISTTGAVILSERWRSARPHEPTPPRRPAPVSLSVQVDPRAPGLMLRGSF